MPPAKKEAEREKFIAWLALPATERKPKTQRELARRLRVDPATLSDWKTPELLREVRGRVDTSAMEYHADVIHALCKKAIGGNVEAQKLYLKYIQGWVEKQRHEVTHADPFAGRTDEEKEFFIRTGWWPEEVEAMQRDKGKKPN